MDFQQKAQKQVDFSGKACYNGPALTPFSISLWMADFGNRRNTWKEISLLTFVKFRAAACAALFLSCLALPCAQADPPASPAHAQVPASSSASAPDKNVPNRHSTRGQYLARTALSFRGAPYRWGGRSARSGFDCSGLVQAVYAKWGIALPRAARAQYQKGKSVAKADLQAGDLVFFKNTYRRGLSHVGIYIGDGFFIHAATQRQGVVISSLNAGYHSKHWAGARRLDLAKLPPVPGEETAAAKARVYVENADGSETETGK